MGIRFVWGDELERIEFERVVEQLMEQSLGPQLAGNLLRHAARAARRRVAAGLATACTFSKRTRSPGRDAVARRPAAVHLEHVAAGDARDRAARW